MLPPHDSLDARKSELVPLGAFKFRFRNNIHGQSAKEKFTTDPVV